MKVTDVKEVSSLQDAGSVRSPRPAETKPDKVSVNQSQEVLRAIQSAKVSSGAGRSERLRQLEQSIRSGNYNPNPAQIAERILDDAELSARLQAMLKG